MAGGLRATANVCRIQPIVVHGYERSVYRRTVTHYYPNSDQRLLIDEFFRTYSPSHDMHGGNWRDRGSLGTCVSVHMRRMQPRGYPNREYYNGLVPACSPPSHVQIGKSGCKMGPAHLVSCPPASYSAHKFYKHPRNAAASRAGIKHLQCNVARNRRCKCDSLRNISLFRDAGRTESAISNQRNPYLSHSQTLVEGIPWYNYNSSDYHDGELRGNQRHELMACFTMRKVKPFFLS
ncbi:hypothetical protein DFH27DRAFT_523291 [Peziza echinospora]|nr:hypothetical protein DFH27DRAFT_523291 [Peziza echinospora]